MSQFLLSFLAGTLTSLSPCVLPLIPLVVGSALQAHRLGPVVLCLGMTLAFSIAGVLLSSTGSILGLSPDTLRILGGGLFILAGLILLLPKLNDRLAVAMAPIANKAQGLISKLSPDTLKGQFLIGALLGALWSPCSGPTLGTAAVLAAQTGTMLQGFSLMLIFGLGASIPLLLIAYGSRTVFNKQRNKLISFGKRSKQLFGFILLLLGIAIIFNIDKWIETQLLGIIPEWITDLSIRF